MQCCLVTYIVSHPHSRGGVPGVPFYFNFLPFNCILMSWASCLLLNKLNGITDAGQSDREGAGDSHGGRRWPTQVEDSERRRCSTGRTTGSAAAAAAAASARDQRVITNMTSELHSANTDRRNTIRCDTASLYAPCA